MQEFPVYKTTQFENGLTVSTCEMPYMNSVCIGLWVGIGSRYEAMKISGTTHFIEHMLFKGTKSRSAFDISSEIESIGGHINAWTSEESTCFHTTASAKHFKTLLAVLMDMFHFSLFSEPDIDKEREVIKEEISMYRDQPGQYVEDLLNGAMWENHPLGRPITGTEETVDNLTRNILIDFKHKNYSASNTYIAVAGAVSHSEAVEVVLKYKSYFNTCPPPVFTPAISLQEKPIIKLSTRDIEQSNIALGFKTCSRHSNCRYALRVLNAIVAENMSSRLFHLLRDELGLAYNIYSNPTFLEDTGDWTILAGMDNDNIFKTINVILKELKIFKSERISEKEINTAKNYLIGQMEIALETTENQMNWIGEQLSGYKNIVSPVEIIECVNKVTGDEIKAIANQYIKPQNATLALVCSLKNEKCLSELFGILN